MDPWQQATSTGSPFLISFPDQPVTLVISASFMFLFQITFPDHSLVLKSNVTPFLSISWQNTTHGARELRSEHQGKFFRVRDVVLAGTGQQLKSVGYHALLTYKLSTLVREQDPVPQTMLNPLNNQFIIRNMIFQLLCNYSIFHTCIYCRFSCNFQSSSHQELWDYELIKPWY